MEDNKCVECGMPTDETTKCTCTPENCVHCCKCEEGCECNCKEKSDAAIDGEMKEEEGEEPKEETVE